jgi:hypothetical protein
LKRWGATGAASVIEARIQELGGEPREESVPDRAARFERSRKLSEHRQQFLNSEPGVNAANAEFETLTSVVQRLVAAIKESASGVSLQVKTARCQLLVLGLRVGLSVEWRYQFRNTLDNAKLYVTLWNTHPPFPGIHHFDEPRMLGQETFTFDLLPSGECCWASDGYVERSFDAQQLGDHILKYYIDEAESYSPDADWSVFSPSMESFLKRTASASFVPRLLSIGPSMSASIRQPRMGVIRAQCAASPRLAR